MSTGAQWSIEMDHYHGRDTLPGPSAKQLEREREANTEVDLTCEDCGFTYTGEHSEPESCLHCESTNVGRAV